MPRNSLIQDSNVITFGPVFCPISLSTYHRKGTYTKSFSRSLHPFKNLWWPLNLKLKIHHDLRGVCVCVPYRNRNNPFLSCDGNPKEGYKQYTKKAFRSMPTCILLHQSTLKRANTSLIWLLKHVSRGFFWDVC